MTPASDRARVHRLIGVYDADGTWRGEISYWIAARLGRAHCSLCDITHGSVRERSDWRACRAGLPVPFDTYHRDDQPEAVRAAADGRVPVVVADTDGGPVVLLDGTALDGCAGSVEAFQDALERAMAELGLSWE